MSLDILRIVAALMVLMVHVGQWTGLNKWTDVGAKGVPLFFILSGYLAMVSCHRIFKHGWHCKRLLYRTCKAYFANVLLGIIS